MMSNIVKVVDLVPGQVAEIPRHSAADLDADTFWRSYVVAQRPVVITGAIADWPALQRWQDTEYLAAHAGDTEVTVARTFNPVPAKAFFDRAEKLPLAASLRNMADSEPTDVYSMPAFKLPERWLADLGRYSFLPERYDRRPILFPRNRVFVYRNAGTEWHHHGIDETLTTQLRGRKRVSVFELDAQTRKEFTRIIRSNLHHVNGGAKFFPPELSIVKYETIIEAGDVVYIPPRYWHGIDPYDNEIGITFAHCFRSPAEGIRQTLRWVGNGFK